MQGIENGMSEGLHAVSVMTANEIATYLLKHCRALRAFDSYMFGSTLHGVGRDIDILIVGPSGEPLSLLKQEIALAGMALPLDVLYMDPTEAIETSFVSREKCVELTVLASIGIRRGI